MNEVINTTTMSAPGVPRGQSLLAGHFMWIPYLLVGLLFVLGLSWSFRRYHVRYAKKKRYITEYREENLSVRKPRISGKLTLKADDICVDTRTTSPLTAVSSAVGSPKRDSYLPLSSDDIQVAMDPDVLLDRDRMFHSMEIADDFRSYYRQLSDDDYFKRIGARQALFMKYSSERHLPRRRKVHNSNTAGKSFWIKSDPRRASATESVRDSVKYIKVFDLDLCNDCRLHVDRVGESVNKDVQTVVNNIDLHCSKNADISVDSEATVLHPSQMNSVVQESRTNSGHNVPKTPVNTHREDSCVEDNHPEISIAQVHSPPPSSESIEHQTLNSDLNHDPTKLNAAGLPIFDSGRSRSVPELGARNTEFSNLFKLGMQESAFKLRPQFAFNSSSRPSQPARTRDRDKSGIFWLDVNKSYQHTLV